MRKSTTVINAKFLQNVWASEKLKSSLIFFFLLKTILSQKRADRQVRAIYLGYYLRS
jgi:hypothetical protein